MTTTERRVTGTRAERGAVVLAGGHSTRFAGGDKALATVDGRPLVSHAVRSVAPVVDTVVVSCRADQRAALAGALETPVQFVVDPDGESGPIAGLRRSLTVLGTAGCGRVVVTACDMPGVTPGVVRTLFGAAERSATSDPTGECPVPDHSAAAVCVDGRPQPLPAVYPVERAYRACADTHRLAALLDRAEPTVLDAGDLPVSVARTTWNVNTREALHRFRARYGTDVDPRPPRERV